MRRPPDRNIEAMARLFLIGALMGLITILLSCYYTLQSYVPPLIDTTELNAAIRAVDGARVNQLLQELNSTGFPHTLKPDQHPMYVVTCMPEDTTAEAQEIVRQVAYTFRGVPLDVDYAHHPLTAAYRHHRYHAARILLEVSRQFLPRMFYPMSEVYASALTLAELREVDPAVHVYCEARDNFRCRSVVDPSRIRSSETSQLEAAYRLAHNRAQTPPARIPYRDHDVPRRVVAPASTVRAGIWNDPFRPPLPDLLPPRGALVVNPAYFSDPGDQFLYMVFGHVEGSLVLTSFVFYALAVTIVCLASWSIGVTWWMAHQH